jgi:hypothetical protein
MRLFEILLPALHNDQRHSYEQERITWGREAVKLTGGVTLLPMVDGVYIGDSGREYREAMIPYRVACSPATFHKLLDYAWELFADQEAFRVVDLGAAHIAKRPAPHP